MANLTSFHEIYKMLGAIIIRSTGRAWFKKQLKQGRVQGPHALIFLTSGNGDEKQITESVTIDSILTDIVWSTKTIECMVEFYGSRGNDSAIDAASRLATSLYLSERNYDLNTITTLSGGVNINDLSAIFMEDIDQRAQVRFNLLANVGLPLPLVGTEAELMDSVEITTTHLVDDSETVITIERGVEP